MRWVSPRPEMTAVAVPGSSSLPVYPKGERREVYAVLVPLLPFQTCTLGWEERRKSHPGATPALQSASGLGFLLLERGWQEDFVVERRKPLCASPAYKAPHSPKRILGSIWALDFPLNPSVPWKSRVTLLACKGVMVVLGASKSHWDISDMRKQLQVAPGEV